MDAEDRQRKKAWQSREREGAQRALPLAAELLESLFAFVGQAVDQDGCDHTLKATHSWIAQHGVAQEPLVAWLRENGGYCDCEVVANAKDHWKQNR
jgi:hypothetical protein